MNSHPTLDKLQHAIVSLFFECLKLHDPVTPLEFSLSGDFRGKFNAVVGVLDTDDENAMVVATLPRYSKTVFIGLTRSGELDLARLLANLEDLERENTKPLVLGEVIGHPMAPGESDTSPFATILLPVATSAILRNLPPIAVFDNQEIRIVFVLPLSRGELECRNVLGHDAMIDMFQREGKSLFFQ
ncbi:MAG: hypothetical protein KAY82_05365 [Hylemonella sp.]|nr:hypothetical protein [Hylemonella sp.]